LTVRGVVISESVLGSAEAPAPATAAPAPERQLRLADPMMQGDDVRGVQEKLGIAADGIFGPATRDAVVAFQTAHGLGADGVVGPATLSALGL
jgi:peptidoglycan hydrolase-like protein with peptidoglycan-binding domain